MSDEDLAPLDEADGGGGAGGGGQPGGGGPPVGPVLHHLLLHREEALPDGPQHSLVVLAPEALDGEAIQTSSSQSRKPKLPKLLTSLMARD